ncbi:serine protease [Haloechinothrix salitolerans]|uniref:S1 family peptidase n=1 Tax=Haloechinothrix salitolerans TaxID=926830 RepID=A0ABW2BX36_9PSEU
MRVTRKHTAVGAAIATAVAVAATVVLTQPAQAIVGGEQAAEGQYPFMASLQDGDFHFCGGSVVAPDWVLTAAHCVEDATPSDQDVVVGKTDLDAEGGQRVDVTEIHVHPDYDGTHDAALLKLAESVSVPIIPLADANDDDLEAEGTPLTVAGWGTEFFGSPTTPSHLKRADVEAVADDRCEGMTGNGLAGFDPETEICAEELLADSCQGDSGGPLFHELDGRLVQLGIVSWGVGCAFPGFPGVYAEVNNPSILEFITATITGGTSPSDPTSPEDDEPRGNGNGGNSDNAGGNGNGGNSDRAGDNGNGKGPKE